MAGKYNRFRLFGNKIPKYLLPLGSSTMLSEVLSHFIKINSISNILLIANRSDQIFYPIMRSILLKFKINSDSLIYIDDTNSQLETALFSSEHFTSSESCKPVAFANIDTILINRQYFFDMLQKIKHDQGLLDIFTASNKYYSYAMLGSKENVVDVDDENRISQYACSVLYGFGSLNTFNIIAKDLLRNNYSSNFTSIYKKYINDNKLIKYHMCTDGSNTIVLGTPDEYLLNIHKFN